MFTAPTFATFTLLVTGALNAVGPRTVSGMWTAAGIAERVHWSVAHRFFSHAHWDLDALGLALARLVVDLFTIDAQALTLAVDDTLFHRYGRKVSSEGRRLELNPRPGHGQGPSPPDDPLRSLRRPARRPTRRRPLPAADPAAHIGNAPGRGVPPMLLFTQGGERSPLQSTATPADPMSGTRGSGRSLSMAFTVEATNYGFRSMIHGGESRQDVTDWLAAVEDVLCGRATFNQLIDMRGQERITGGEFTAAIHESMQYLKSRGLQRSVLVVHSPHIALKIKQTAFWTPLYEWERYLDGSDPNWERAALDWIEHGIDPDSRPKPTARAAALSTLPPSARERREAAQ